MLTFVLVGCGGFIGALGRYAVSKMSFNRHGGAFPRATFAVNLLGSLILGFLFGYNVNNQCLLFFGTGMMGSFTTFSTFSLEGLQLIKVGKIKLYLVYLLTSVSAGVLLAFIGFALGRYIS